MDNRIAQRESLWLRKVAEIVADLELSAPMDIDQIIARIGAKRGAATIEFKPLDLSLNFSGAAFMLTDPLSYIIAHNARLYEPALTLTKAHEGVHIYIGDADKLDLDGWYERLSLMRQGQGHACLTLDPAADPLHEQMVEFMATHLVRFGDGAHYTSTRAAYGQMYGYAPSEAAYDL